MRFCGFFKRRAGVAELSAWIFFLLIQVIFFKDLLLTQKFTLAHDNYFHALSSFHFFSRNIANGEWAFWNPFRHGGEPFYPMLVQFRLLEPVPLIMSWLWSKVIDGDTVTLFNWIRFVQTWVFVLGIYLIARDWCRKAILRILLIPILLFSSVTLVSFRQDGIINQFLWAPFLFLVLNQVFMAKRKNLSVAWWVALGLLIGINWQSYFFTGAFISILFLLIGILADKKLRQKLRERFTSFYGEWWKVGICLLISVIMMAPNLALLLERSEYVYPARLYDGNKENRAIDAMTYSEEGSLDLIANNEIRMSYDLIAKTGSSFNPWNLLQAFSPFGNQFIVANEVWGNPSEAYIFLGGFSFLFILLGFFVGRHPWKKFWLIQLCLNLLFILGPAAGLHWLLFHTYPPAQFLRNCHALVLYFITCLLFFFLIGVNWVFSKPSAIKLRAKIDGMNFSLTLALAVAFSGVWFSWIKFHELFLNMGLSLSAIPLVLFFAFAWISSSKLSKLQLWLAFTLGFFFTIFSGLAMITDGKLMLFKSTISHLFLVGFIFGLFLLRKNISQTFGFKLRMQAWSLVLLAVLAAEMMYGAWFAKPLHARVENPAKNYKNLQINAPFIPHMSRGNDAITPPRYQQALLSPETLLENYRSFTPLRRFSATDLKQVLGQYFYLDARLDMDMYYRIASGAGHEPLEIDENGYREIQKNLIHYLNELPSRDSFHVQYLGRRWHSHSVLKSYYELIHSGLSPHTAAFLFANNSPLFQFKSEAEYVGPGGSIQLLKKIEQSGMLVSERLRDSVILEGSSGPEPTQDFQLKSAVDTSTSFRWEYLSEKHFLQKLTVRFSTAKAGFIYWADGFHPGWRAFLGNKEVPIFRANHNFKAVAIPAGVHEISFMFWPKLFGPAVILFYVTMFLSFFVIIVGLIRRRLWCGAEQIT